MKSMFRFCGLLLLYALFVLSSARGQIATPNVSRIEIKHVGPPAVSDEMVRSNIRVKTGDPYRPAAIDEDVRSLYGTGLFYNIRVSQETTADGVALTYVVQGKPRLTDIKFRGNAKFSSGKLRKKITSKVSEPLDERKLFTDSQEIQKMYQKAGYPRTQVKYVLDIDENAGRGTATFEITETPKVKIMKVEFVGATAFPQSIGFFEKLFHPSHVGLRKTIKTRKHWMFSWLTGSGFLKDEQFEDDQEKLKEFYRDKGYIDFDIKNIEFLKKDKYIGAIRESEEFKKVVAEADREKTRILAEAYREAGRTKGEGDARAMRIYAEAFGKNPQLYKFRRTLQAYETILGGNTTIFLPADAEVFRLLGDAGKSKKGKSP